MIRVAEGLEIWGGQTMHAECEGKFTAVVKVVFDDMPDDPLARDQFVPSAEGLIKFRITERKYVLYHLPGCFKSTNSPRRYVRAHRRHPSLPLSKV
jgi:hypothetical protein